MIKRLFTAAIVLGAHRTQAFSSALIKQNRSANNALTSLFSRNKALGSPLNDMMKFVADMEKDMTRGLGSWGGRFTVALPLDVKETPNSYEISVDVPGVKKEDVKVKISDHVLFVSTERQSYKEEEATNFWRIERHHGTASRSLVLPTDADEEKITASNENGVLHIHLPKVEGEQCTPEKTIDVK